MPSPTIILLILLGVAGAALAGSGWYITELLEQRGALTQKINEANLETIRQKNITERLRIEVAKEQTALRGMSEGRTADNVRHQKEITRLNSRIESSRKAAVKFPERYGAIATFRLRRGMRDVCRSGKGGTGTCKIISVRPGKTSPNPSREPDPVPNDKRNREAIDGRGPTVQLNRNDN